MGLFSSHFIINFRPTEATWSKGRAIALIISTWSYSVLDKRIVTGNVPQILPPERTQTGVHPGEDIL